MSNCLYSGVGSIGNVAFVGLDREFLIPASENKLEGTTLKNAMKKIQEMVEKGVLKAIIEIPVKPCDVYKKITEMIIFKGDDVIPVLECKIISVLLYFVVDDVKISEKKGPICAEVSL